MTTPTEHPILFSGPMVQAILEGRKTQTRRVIKEHKIERLASRREFATAGPHQLSLRETPGYAYVQLKSGSLVGLPCPYGRPGDRLWVRERMRVIEVVDYGSTVAAIRVRYEADGAESNFIAYPDRLEGTPVAGKCLAYGGFREASRITLEIMDVRIERLHEIGQPDAIAEGITATKYGCHRHDELGGCVTLVEGFAALWDSINARGHSWNSNPWVWVVSFKRVTRPGWVQGGPA